MPKDLKAGSLLFYMIPLLIVICAHSCQQGNGRSWFAIRDTSNSSVFQLDDTLHLEIAGSRKRKAADSVRWFIDDTPLTGIENARSNINGNVDSDLRIDLAAYELGLGARQVAAKVWSEGKQYDTQMDIVIVSDTEPDLVSWEIVHRYPHDTSAYTQGLFYADGHLYESTGRKGESTLRKTQVNGEIRKQVALAENDFGEGACLLNGTIYQLTWKGGKGFTYSSELEKTGGFLYPEPFDGWGLTTDGRYLIVSDGSHLIRFLDPRDSMKIVRRLEVFDNKEAVKLLNELEYVEGILYANVYTKDYIVGIDPATGKVLLKIDLQGLLPKEAHYEGFDTYNYVLNGIARDPRTGHFYITGKKWPLLFEVSLSEAGTTVGE